MQPTRMGKEGLDIVANESTEGGMTVRAQIGGIKVDDEQSCERSPKNRSRSKIKITAKDLDQIAKRSILCHKI